MNIKKLDLFHISSFVCLLVLLIMVTFSALNPLMIIITAIFLGIGVTGAIHHAEGLAKRVGPSLGALILAVAVTVIEVGLILSLMTYESTGASVIARDTVFSAVIIVTNGIVGFCFLLGGFRYNELEFQTEGVTSMLAVLATLVGVTLVLPNYTVTTPGPFYSQSQLIFVSIASVILYAAMVVSQTITHKAYFKNIDEEELKKEDRPSKSTAIFSAVCLVISLVCVIGLAKILSPSIQSILKSVGAPANTVGIILALLVLLPEAGAALAAARANQLQTSLNLALGSGAASVALTIPVISFYSIVAGKQLALGLGVKDLAFMIITFIICGLTLGTGKTSFLKGVVHLVILFSYVILAFIP